MNADSKNSTRIYPLGDNALTVEFGNSISAEMNRRVLTLTKYFEENPFSGLIETVPAYASLTCFYDVNVVKHTFANFPTVFETVKNLVENALETASEIDDSHSRLIEIPVSFKRQDALDLKFVAEINDLSVRDVIRIFTAQTYRVFMLGFIPGFAYLGEVDQRIAAPRKEIPRTAVPKGSVGIAGRQTGIYPIESPGGWQIIGKTDLKMFDITAKNPCVLRVGDAVKFYEHSL